jgi:GNAT superfamily N-acetyltransferase
MWVRAARADDLQSIVAFDEWKEVEASDIATGQCYCAGFGDRPEAYGLLNFGFFYRPFVATLFVSANARRRGLGDALLAHMEKACGKERLWISTGLRNPQMQALLHKRGYRLSGVIENLSKIPELIYYRDIDHSE